MEDLSSRLSEQADQIAEVLAHEIGKYTHASVSNPESIQPLFQTNLRKLIELLYADTVDPERAAEIGAAICKLRFISFKWLSTVLIDFYRLFMPYLATTLYPRFLEILAYAHIGYIQEFREQILSEQESLRQTVMAERDQTLEQLREANQKLQSLAQQLLDAQESERINLARVLHDSLLNNIVAIGISSKGNELFPEDKISAISRHIRQLIQDLRPPLLDHGLYLAIDEMFDSWNERTRGKSKISVAVDPSNGRYPPEVETHVYRIVQQAVANAIRHSKATEITVQGQLLADSLDLTVGDNGIGSDLNNILKSSDQENIRHYGLVGMVERSIIIGAKLLFDSKPGRGTCVRITWQADQAAPLAPSAAPSVG